MERSGKVELVVVSDAALRQMIAVPHFTDREFRSREPIFGLFIRQSVDQRNVIDIGLLAVFGFITGRVYSISTGT
jgi:hypothetical protein